MKSKVNFWKHIGEFYARSLIKKCILHQYLLTLYSRIKPLQFSNHLLMKRSILLTVASIAFSTASWAQCTTSDGTDCFCPDGVSTQCELLPDLTLSWDALENWSDGPSEYAQTGEGTNNGRLRISGSTPNIGWGAFEVWSTDWYVCGTDTFYSASSPDGTCIDGNTGQSHETKQLLNQRVYQKDGNGMNYYDRYAGAMTYHPTHNHYHVDDWVTFTLRTQDTTEANPLNWPIIGDGAKIGFCLMDYGRCGSSTYSGHCRDSQSVYGQGTILGNSDFANYGHGGMQYSCSPIVQGISVGWTDVYGEHLDGMWIDVPPGTCNGDYWIVGQVDPNNNFLEFNEGNNWTAIPFTLTKQVPGNEGPVEVLADGALTQCEGNQITLTAEDGISYVWSTGDTTQSIVVDETGNYSVEMTSNCGVANSETIPVVLTHIDAPATENDTVWAPSGSATLTATGTDLYWYDQSTGGTLVGTGTSYSTPVLNATTTYYVEDIVTTPGTTYNTGKPDNSGGGGYFSGDQDLIFSAMSDFMLKSVKVYAQGAGNRVIILEDDQGSVLETATVDLPDGESRADLNWNIPIGTNYHMTLTGNMKDLYRNNDGVNFPYAVSNVVEVTTSSAGDQYYYFFYDWEVETPELTCVSERAPVDAVINPDVSVGGEELVSNFQLYPNPSEGIVNISFSVNSASDVVVRIFDPNGKLVFTEDVRSFNGTFNKAIDLSSYAKGLYHVDMNINGQQVRETIVVK